MLQKISIQNHLLSSGKPFNGTLSYEVFGKALGEAPIVLVNHALTGNSTVCGEKGWWNGIIGKGKAIDTRYYTVLSFNIPGNAYDGVIVEDYKDFVLRDVASLFLKGLELLSISEVFAVIGGSLGGALAWQMAYLQPTLFQKVIPVATDYKASDWVLAQTYLQERILQNSTQPMLDARVHAMLMYRTPASLNERFQGEYDEAKNKYKIEDWLDYHGNALEQRFQLKAYFLMNNLLRTINVADSVTDLAKIKADLHIIAVDTDLFFTAERNKKTFEDLKPIKKNIYYYEINSVHGHDAFLIENEQLEILLKSVL